LIKERGDSITFYAGIRNNITSYQALSRILDAGCNLYVIDTGSNVRIFHGKIYAANDDSSGRVIIGSANSTFNGLNNSLEIGANISLNLKSVEDEAYLESIHAYFATLRNDYPNNCFEIESQAACATLLADGLVIDETRTPRTSPVRNRNSSGNIRPNSMDLPFVPPPAAEQPKRQEEDRQVRIVRPAPTGTILQGQLLWTKPSLTMRDMQLVQGNPSGNVCLTQAGFRVDGELIEWTSYFRNTIFGTLNWTRKNNKDVTTAQFALIIDGIDHGVYALKISHKPSWEARQGNYTTAIHWGPTKNLITNQALVGKKFHLYECDTRAADYIIEITD
jgi:hypothetical protein